MAEARRGPPVPEAAPAPPDGGGALPLAAAAGLSGCYRWVEHRLFELTGAWAAAEAPPAVQLHLDEVSLQHAWHAELWADRLPVLAGVDPEALTVPAGPVAGPLLDALAKAGSAGAPGALTGRRLAGLYRVVLPRLSVSYAGHLRRALPFTDGPVIRVLRLVLADEAESQLAGEALLQSQLGTPAAAAVAAEAQARLEALIVAAGPGAGLVPWPG